MYREYWNRWQPTKGSLALFFEGEGNGAGGGGGEGTTITTTTTKKEDKEEEYTEAEIAEMEQGRQIMTVLKDPNSRLAFVKELMKAEGITDKSTEKEVKAAKKTVDGILKEALGDEYQVLHGRLSKAFTEILDLFDEERVKPVGNKITANEDRAARTEAQKGYDAAFAEFSNSKSLEQEVTSLIKEFPPSKDTDPQKYFRRLLKMAADEKGVRLLPVGAKNKAVDDFQSLRRKANSSDASSRLASEGTSEESVQNPNKGNMKIDDAILAGAKAAEALLFKNK